MSSVYQTQKKTSWKRVVHKRLQIFQQLLGNLVPPLEYIQPVVLNDSKITVEYDIVTGTKGNDGKSERNSAEVTTKKATVQQKAEESSERVGTRAKGGTNNYKIIKLTPTPSKSVNHPIHFSNDTPSPPPIIPRCSESGPSYHDLLPQGYKSHNFYF
ncbi:hypothetical protein ACOME3_008382 [Neoechinorhynchus agilis]